MRTQLPIFKGYYGNIFTEGIEDYEFEYVNDERVNNNKKPFKNDELFEYDYENYFKELSESLCYKVWNILEDFIKEIKFIKLESPKYYNFENDIIICDIKPNKKMIKTYIKNNYKNWSKYLKDNFGEVTTDLSNSESVVNMYVYIVGEHILQDVINHIKERV